MYHHLLKELCRLRLWMLLAAILCTGALTGHAQISINSKNFPDEHFRNYLLEQSYGKDGILTEEEIKRVTSINVRRQGISSLKGIEYFTALTILSCPENQLTSLDVSKNTALENLSCYKNQLTSLDVSKNTVLTYLGFYGNQIIGHDMDALISNLPENISSSTRHFRVVYSKDEIGFNECTKEQAAAVKAKGWIPEYYDENEYTWMEYEGMQPMIIIRIDTENFPDKNFRNYLLEQSYGKDGILTEEEIKGITEIVVSYKNINSLKGIEHFTALAILTCNNNQLMALDVSKNLVLTQLECNDNQLTSLDVSGATALTELYCAENQLMSLDISNNTALNNLDCSSNQLTFLDVSNNTALTALYCFNNQLTALDVRNNTPLLTLEFYGNQIKGNDMDALISSLPANTTNWKRSFRVVYSREESGFNECTKKQATAVKEKGWTPEYYDENKNNWMDYLTINVNINSENFPDENFRNYLLEQPYGKDGVLTVEEINDITEIYIPYRKISSLKGIEHFTVLTYLYCSNNQLTSLDVSENTTLTVLYCADNQLFSLDVSKNTELTKLFCADNQLTTLDVSNNTALSYLECYDNQLTSLDVSNNTALTGLSCGGNQLTSLDVSKNTALKYLYCNNNQLTVLDVSKNTALTKLKCRSNQLTSLDVSENTALSYLECYDNQLTSLDVSNNTALSELRCADNQLTTLDVSKNTSLWILLCNNNQLTSLDLSENNTALTYLYFYGNRIKGSAMDALISSLPVNTTSIKTHFNVVRSKDETGFNECTKQQAAAVKAKGWIPGYYDENKKMWMEYEGRDVATQIESVLMTRQDAPVFSLSGQRLAAPKKGVNIVGGRKVVIK